MLLIEEHGGACKICGYDRYHGALEFHHIDPTTKVVGLGKLQNSASIEAMRVEAKKCILLCSNCHREVEAGLRCEVI